CIRRKLVLELERGQLALDPLVDRAAARVDLGELEGPRGDQGRAGLEHPGGRDVYVVVLLQRDPDQLLQYLVLEHRPPGEVADRRGGRRPGLLAPEGRRYVDVRALVVRAHGAGAGQQEQQQEPGGSPHGYRRRWGQIGEHACRWRHGARWVRRGAIGPWSHGPIPSRRGRAPHPPG